MTLQIPTIAAALLLCGSASAQTETKASIFNTSDVKTVFGPRLLTDDLQPMFGARIDHAFSDRIAGSLTGGATSNWGAQIDGGTATLGLDLHPVRRPSSLPISAQALVS